MYLSGYMYGDVSNTPHPHKYVCTKSDLMYRYISNLAQAPITVSRQQIDDAV